MGQKEKEEIFTDLKSLSKAVRERLKKMKLSVYKLEEQTGVSKTHIHRILKGSGKVSLKYYIKIAKILDIKYCFTNVEQIFSEFFKPDEYEIIDSNKKTTKERKKKNEQ